ncbi:3624_t:CDS:1, partial [Funneliformis caledonium]
MPFNKVDKKLLKDYIAIDTNNNTYQELISLYKLSINNNQKVLKEYTSTINKLSSNIKNYSTVLSAVMMAIALAIFLVAKIIVLI